jgi:RND family efflux transporter MFP subunit
MPPYTSSFSTTPRVPPAPPPPPPPPSPPKPPEDKKKTGGKGKLFLTVLIIVAAGIAAIGIADRIADESALKSETRKAAVASVVVMKAAEGPADEEVVLPGNVEAWHEAPIYARTSGYLKSWSTDIGTPVKAGDLIAEIDTPEVDAQYRQAQADLGTAQANNDLAQTTLTRWTELLKTHAVSKQDYDDKAGAAAATLASMKSAQANMERLQQLEDFKRITAPFDGVITARNTDTGALINAGSSGVGPELFHIAETDKLRIYVQVPEIDVPSVTPNMAADLVFVEHPGKTYQAKLVRTAGALDPTTRSLLIELESDNSKGELLPGGYAEVHLKLVSPPETVRLPVNTLLFRSDGMNAATVGSDNKTVLKPVTIGRDYGKDVEVTAGVKPGETIIVNPPDSILQGQKVRVVTPGQDGKDDAADDTKDDDGKDGTKSDDGDDDDKDGNKKDDDGK